MTTRPRGRPKGAHLDPKILADRLGAADARGLSAGEIAAEHGVTTDTVRRWRAVSGVPAPTATTSPRPSANPTLTVEQLRRTAHLTLREAVANLAIPGLRMVDVRRARADAGIAGADRASARQVNVLLAGEAGAALETLTERWSLSPTAAVRRAVIEAAQLG